MVRFGIRKKSTKSERKSISSRVKSRQDAKRKTVLPKRGVNQSSYEAGFFEFLKIFWNNNRSMDLCNLTRQVAKAWHHLLPQPKLDKQRILRDYYDAYKSLKQEQFIRSKEEALERKARRERMRREEEEKHEKSRSDEDAQTGSGSDENRNNFDDDTGSEGSLNRSRSRSRSITGGESGTSNPDESDEKDSESGRSTSGSENERRTRKRGAKRRSKKKKGRKYKSYEDYLRATNPKKLENKEEKQDNQDDKKEENQETKQEQKEENKEETQDAIVFPAREETSFDRIVEADIENQTELLKKLKICRPYPEIPYDNSSKSDDSSGDPIGDPKFPNLPKRNDSKRLLPTFSNPTNTLLVKNLAPDVKQPDLQELFRGFLNDIVLIRVLDAKYSGEAVVEFKTVEVAEYVWRQMNGVEYKKMPLVIEFANKDDLSDD